MTTLAPPRPLTFNTLLELAGLPIDDVELMRHADDRTPYQLWVMYQQNNDPAFLLYQGLQTDRHRIKHRYIASFVVTPDGDTLFAGIYENQGNQGRAPKGTLCPVSGVDVSSDHDLYALKETSYLSEWVGRLTIAWTGGHINWQQPAQNNHEKQILALREQQYEDNFPGFDQFDWPINDLTAIPQSWEQILKHSQGVYLLICEETGKQYVGSATGAEGFYQRWLGYKNGNDNGNDKMKSHTTSGYRVKILQAYIISDNVTLENGDTIPKIEHRWIRKLETQEFGLNS